MNAIENMDVDFERVFERNDNQYIAGCLQRDPFAEPEGNTFASAEITGVPRSEWKKRIDAGGNSNRELIKKIRDQGQEGSCACNAAVQAYQTVFFRTYGFWMEFSPITIYKHLARGPNQGTTIDGNLKWLTERGLLPLDTPGNRGRLGKMGLDPSHVLQSTGHGQRFPSGWEETAKHFRADESIDSANYEQFISLLFADVPVVYGRAGHAILGIDAVWRSGGIYNVYANSWRPTWGDEGYGYDSERAVSRSMNSYGAWGLASILHPQGIENLIDIPPAPEV